MRKYFTFVYAIFLCILLVMAIQTVCYSDVTKLSAELHSVLQNASRFHEIHSITTLPLAVVALCADESGRFAEPDKKWEATDVITDTKLPRKRLIWAAIGGEYYIVHYERGGYSHSFHILVAMLTKGDSKAMVLWRGVGEQLKDYSDFLIALRTGKLDDRLDYAH